MGKSQEIKTIIEEVNITPISSAIKTRIVSYTFDTNSNYNVTFATNNNQMLSITLGYGIAQQLSSYTVFYRIF